MDDRSPLNVAHVVAWSSSFFGFGLVQGAIYLKSYWGRFLLEPFQFGDVSDLAVGGLIGFGVTLAFIAVAAMFGSILGHWLGCASRRYRWVVGITFFLILVGLFALVLFVKFGLYLASGVVLSWTLVALVKRSPDLPDSVKGFEFLPYMALAIAYVPLGAYHLGQRHADDVVEGRRGGLVEDPLHVTSRQQFVGRLGDVYVFWRKEDGAVTLKPVDSIEQITILRTGK